MDGLIVVLENGRINANLSELPKINGLELSFLSTSNDNRAFKPFSHSRVIFMESKTPNFKEDNMDNVINSDGAAVIPILPNTLFDFFS